MMNALLLYTNKINLSTKISQLFPSKKRSNCQLSQTAVTSKIIQNIPMVSHGNKKETRTNTKKNLPLYQLFHQAEPLGHIDLCCCGINFGIALHTTIFFVVTTVNNKGNRV